MDEGFEGRSAGLMARKELYLMLRARMRCWARAALRRSRYSVSIAALGMVGVWQVCSSLSQEDYSKKIGEMYGSEV